MPCVVKFGGKKEKVADISFASVGFFVTFHETTLGLLLEDV